MDCSSLGSFHTVVSCCHGDGEANDVQWNQKGLMPISILILILMLMLIKILILILTPVPILFSIPILLLCQS